MLAKGREGVQTLAILNKSPLTTEKLQTVRGLLNMHQAVYENAGGNKAFENALAYQFGNLD